MVEIRKSKREESLLKKRREGLQQGPLFGSSAASANNIVGTVEKKVSLSVYARFRSFYAYIQIQRLSKGGPFYLCIGCVFDTLMLFDTAICIYTMIHINRRP